MGHQITSIHQATLFSLRYGESPNEGRDQNCATSDKFAGKWWDQYGNIEHLHFEDYTSGFIPCECSPREGTNQTRVKDFLGKVPNIYYFTREIDNHDTYFALALIYNVCETQLQVSISSIYSLVCSFVGRHHGDISIYLHHMMF